MTLDTDPQTLHAERFDEIARLIERDVDRLIAEWIAQASAQQPHANAAYRAEMQDRLPAFLRALGKYSAEHKLPMPTWLLWNQHGRCATMTASILHSSVRSTKTFGTVNLARLPLHQGMWRLASRLQMLFD
jgi:hypothetical protein